MSAPENFLSRWSRRKQDAADASEETGAATPESVAPQPTGRAPAIEAQMAAELEQARTEPCEPLFDPQSLPPLESITAATDIRGFLAPGVPAELARAALRRAWAADPTIRDFVGLADYAWDFNSPGSMPGFGPLEMTAELRSQVLRMLGPSPSESPTPDRAPPEREQQVVQSSEKAPMPASIEVDDSARRVAAAAVSAGDRHDRPEPVRTDNNNIAAQHESGEPTATRSITKQRHGGALPK